MKTLLLVSTVAVIAGAGMYFGSDIKALFEKPADVEVRVEKEIVVTDEFAEMVDEFKNSAEGQEVLHVWATQQALEVTRKKLDEIEAQTLTKEASL